MTSDFSPFNSVASCDINSYLSIDFFEDGDIAINIETDDGTETKYTTLDELEEMIKNAREWLTMRKMAKEAQEAFHEEDYANGL